MSWHSKYEEHSWSQERSSQLDVEWIPRLHTVCVDVDLEKKFARVFKILLKGNNKKNITIKS